MRKFIWCVGHMLGTRISRFWWRQYYRVYYYSLDWAAQWDNTKWLYDIEAKAKGDKDVLES